MKDLHVSILERLRYEKAGVQVISDAVSGRVFGEFADHGTVKPYITFDHVSTVSDHLGFSETDKMLHRAQVVIRVYGDIESGAESVCVIADEILESFNFYTDLTVESFESINYKITSGTTIDRVDDTVVAAVGLLAHGIQNTGV